jgi:large conductance mechanosensitive channel
MRLIKEFKEFAMKGNVVDLAVAVIIGTAFGKIVTSLVADIIMPPIGVMMGGVNFTDLKINLNQTVTWNYGNFLQVVVDFVIIALAIFFMVKVMARLKKKEIAEAKKETPLKEELLLTEIRDLLKSGK